MNKEQKHQQLDLVRKLGRLLRDRDLYGNVRGPITDGLDRHIELGSKALYDFHAALIQSPKPKRERKAKA